jgi:hypothetical protein
VNKLRVSISSRHSRTFLKSHRRPYSRASYTASVRQASPWAQRLPQPPPHQHIQFKCPTTRVEISREHGKARQACTAVTTRHSARTTVRRAAPHTDHITRPQHWNSGLILLLVNTRGVIRVHRVRHHRRAVKIRAVASAVESATATLLEQPRRSLAWPTTVRASCCAVSMTKRGASRRRRAALSRVGLRPPLWRLQRLLL